MERIYARDKRRGRTRIINYRDATMARGIPLMYLRRIVSRPRAHGHPKYLHCPVAKLESNRFEMTFHLTKHKSGGPYAPTTLAPTRWLVCGLPGQCPFSFSLYSLFFLPLSLSFISFPSTDDFHGPSGGIAKYRFVDHRLSARQPLGR